MPVKKLTIREIAAMAGVSASSVSRALSGAAGVGPVARKKILKICEKTGYTTNFTARSLAAQKSRLLGLVVGAIDNPFCSALATSVEREARARGYNLILCSSGGLPAQEAEMFRLLLGRMADGIIVHPAQEGSCEALAPYLGQVPTVFVGEAPHGARVNCVTADYYGGMRAAAAHLIGLGHRAIAYIGRRPRNATHQLRAGGYTDAMRAAKLAPAFFDNPLPASSIEQGRALTWQMLAAGRPFTAVLAATDPIALGVMQAADEAGIPIPARLSLCSFDDIPFACLPRIALTTVNQPTEAMGKAAVEMLMGKLAAPGEGYTHEVLAPSLILRGSCQPPAE